jgi:hypothetical protein
MSHHINPLLVQVLTGDPGLVIPALGPHWEEIGFQGLDPRTDINRSMKMFAVLQVRIIHSMRMLRAVFMSYESNDMIK